MAGKVNVLFEIETINRELDFRLFLASLAVDSGTRFYIGQQDTIAELVGESNNALYLGKNIRPIKEDSDDRRNTRYHQLKQRGHKLLYLDEEGGVFWGERPEWEQMMLRNLDPVQLQAEDDVCVWGEVQKEFYLSLKPSCGPRMEITGHPRFDLYKPKYREYFSANVKQLREQYGDFLLVNTNFHRANTVEGLKKIFSNRMQSFTGADRYYLLERWLHINNVLKDFVTVLTTLSVEIPELNIVIRPHPSENVDFYKLFFGGARNVHVVQKGSVGPWLFASRAMMHDGCTTAIEGSMCGAQVINYKPVTDERFDIPLPNLFGVRCKNPEQAVDMMRRVLKGERLEEDVAVAGTRKAQREAETPRLIANFPEEREAFGRFNEKIHEIVEKLPAGPALDVSKTAESRSALDFLRGKGGKPRKKKALEHGMQPKFYGLEKADVPARMNAIKKMLNKEVRYSVFSDELMCIEAD